MNSPSGQYFASFYWPNVGLRAHFGPTPIFWIGEKDNALALALLFEKARLLILV